MRLLDDVGLDLRAGEIVGIAGVSGNGQTELLEVLSGIRAPTGGTLDGARPDDRRRAIPATPPRCATLGVAHVPEDRQRQGMVGGFARQRRPSILGYQERAAVLPRTTCSTARRSAAHCAAADGALRRAAARARLRSASFSGGNQQKLVLAREIAREPKVLLVGQPTRGVDIGAIEFIHRELVKSRDAGCAVLVVSVELDEILALADRILVMFAGRIVGEVRPADADERTLGLMMARRGSRGAGMSAPRRAAAAPGPTSRCCRWSISRWPSSPSASSCASSASIRSHAAAAPGGRARSARREAIGYTLYYATNFIFTGLAVAVAFHAGLFNIGGEGQAYLGGLGCGLAMLAFDRFLPALVLIPLAIVAAAAVRRGVGRHPGLSAGLARQPHRHHHHHVQLHRLGADGLSDGQRADRARLDDAGEPRLHRRGKLPAMHELLAPLGIHGGALAAQSVDRAGAAVLRRRLGVPVAHAVGL